MKHVIYHTEYYNRFGQLLREEESDAYFNAIEGGQTLESEAQPPIGCRLLLPKLLASKLSREQWEYLATKKPDYELRYASLCDGENGEYSYYAIYEKWLGNEENGEISDVFPACVSFGKNEDVTLDMHVIPIDYSLDDEHITRWDEVLFDGPGVSKTDNYIKIVSSPIATKEKQVIIHYNGWTIAGKWDTLEQVSNGIFVYHCYNSISPFDVTINIQRDYLE